MKKTVLTILIVIIILVMPKAVNAADEIKVLLEGEELVFNVQPQMINNRVLVPLRTIFESLGLTVKWDGESRRVIGTNQDTEIILNLDSANFKVNGVTKIFDVSAKIVNGSTLVPVRFIAESLDMNVVYNSDTKVVSISKDDIITWKYESYEKIIPHREYERKYVNGVKNNETRYNGKCHVFGPETRVIDNTNRLVEYNYNSSNVIKLQLSDDKPDYYDNKYYNIKATFNINESLDKGQYHAEIKLNHVYYSLTTNSFSLSKDICLLYNEGDNNKDTRVCVDSKLLNEVYVATIINEVCYRDTRGAHGYLNDFIKVSNENYEKDLNYVKDTIFKEVMQNRAKKEQAEKEKLAKELRENNNIPIKVLKSSVVDNSIGTPEVTLKIKNLSAKTIKAYEVVLYCYDDFNRPVKRILTGSNRFNGISQGNDLKPGETQSDTWNLVMYDLTTQVKNAKITCISFTDGTVWESK